MVNKKHIQSKEAGLITKAELVDMVTGENEVLEEKGERCHFKKEFQYQNYNIVLRLDWGDVVDGDPILDADIFKHVDGKNKKVKNGHWHHTSKESNSEYERDVYIFKFENLVLTLGTKIEKASCIPTDLRWKGLQDKQSSPHKKA